jgi:hypothetical protein
MALKEAASTPVAAGLAVDLVAVLAAVTEGYDHSRWRRIAIRRLRAR